MYKVLRIYDDLTTICEDGGDNFISILNALAIYLEDPMCVGVKVWRSEGGKLVVDYWKEACCQ